MFFTMFLFGENPDGIKLFNIKYIRIKISQEMLYGLSLYTFSKTEIREKYQFIVQTSDYISENHCY